MAEYIERKAIRDALYDADAITMEGVKILNQFPQSDVAPVRHGQWEEASDGDGIVCPFCRTDFCTIIYDTEYFNYCPNCGAKMDGGINNG